MNVDTLWLFNYLNLNLWYLHFKSASDVLSKFGGFNLGEVSMD